MSNQRAAITAIAANTTLGDAVTSSAAARAGLSRPREIEHDHVSPDEGEVQLVGHPIVAAQGFQGDARLLAVALPALMDLAPQLPPSEELGLFLVLPDLEARAAIAAMEVDASDAEPAATAPKTKARPSPAPAEEDDTPPALPKLDVAGRLVGDLALPIPAERRQLFAAGPAGFGLAVRAALDAIERRQLSACIVGGVDTLLDFTALDAFTKQGRLRTPDQAVGFLPGEAAAFLLIESLDGARRRKAPVLGVLTGAALGEERPVKDRPPLGTGVFGAIRGLLETAPLPPQQTFFVTDRNGETSRAHDWGNAQVRLARSAKELLPAPEWDPAVSFGDVGAASGPLGSILVLRGFARGYAPGSCAVILSSSDPGARSAVRIERAS